MHCWNITKFNTYMSKMAATPRKFQEKIALINERAAQGTAAYEEIMQEVSSLRSQPRLISQQQQKNAAPQQAQQLPSRTVYRGSLPDFSINLSQNISSGYYYQYPPQGAVSDLINLTQMYSSSGSACVEPTTILSTSRPHPSLQNSSAHSVSHRHSHLTPPDMLSRSSSDSSLHQTAYQNKIIGSYRKGFVTSGDRQSHLNSMSYQMHKSSAETFPSSDAPLYNHVTRSSAKAIPTPTGNSAGGPGAGPGGGGSLPDLTHVQFIQPMPTPLIDIDSTTTSNYVSLHHLESSQGPYSPRLNGPYMGRSPSSRGTSPGPSPRPSPAMDRKQKTKPYSTPPSLTNQRHLISNKNQLSVPSVINAHHHMFKAIVTDNSIIHPCDPHLSNPPGLNIFGCPLSPSGSHPTSPMSVPLMDYRNPSSPQLSPCASPVPALGSHQTSPMTQYRCSSPDSRGSAPPSPVSLHQSSSPASSPGATLAKPFVYDGFAQTPTANQLNLQFQQITVQSTSIPDQQGDRSTGDMGCNTSTSPSMQSNISPSPTQIFTHPIPSSPSHIPPSPTHPSSPSHSPVSPGGSVSTPLSQHPATPQTPLTPNVPLPRLVVTDQDGNDDKDLLLNEVSEFSSFLFDDYIFRNLSSLGEDELMSVDQILVDNETEESFRRDLRNPNMSQDLLPMDDVTEQFLQQQQHQQQLQQHQSNQQRQHSSVPTQTSTGCQTMPLIHSPAISIPNTIALQQLHRQEDLRSHIQSQQNQSLQQHDQYQKHLQRQLQQQQQDQQEQQREHLKKQQQSPSGNMPSSPSSMQRSMDQAMGMNAANQILSSLEPLDEVSESLLSYSQLQQNMPASPSEYANQLELELHSTVCPSSSTLSGANSPSLNWHQISEPNPQL